MDDSIWKVIATAAIGLLWFAMRRYFKKVDERFDAQDLRFTSFEQKLDSLISKGIKQDRKLLIHDIALRKLDPTIIVHYDD